MCFAKDGEKEGGSSDEVPRVVAVGVEAHRLRESLRAHGALLGVPAGLGAGEELESAELKLVRKLGQQGARDRVVRVVEVDVLAQAFEDALRAEP